MDFHYSSENEKYHNIPLEKKPKITIQDSYLGPYFGLRIEKENSSKLRNKNEIVDDKHKEYKREIIKLLRNEESVIASSEISSSVEKEKKFIGKRKRDKEIDPMDATTVRGYKGNFVSLERRAEKIERMMKHAESKLEKTETQSVKDFKEFTAPALSMKLGDTIINTMNYEGSSVFSGVSTVNTLNKGSNILSRSNVSDTKNEIELIPRAIKNKMKK